MATRVNIGADMITWAIERAGFALDDFLLKHPKVNQWLIAEKQPTVKQLEDFSKKVRIPFGYLLLSEPPKENIPIPFFRTGKGKVDKVPLAVYDTILLLKNRQTWLAGYLDDNGADKLPFVGKYNIEVDYLQIVKDIRSVTGLKMGWAVTHRTWGDALNHLTQAIEEAGIVVTFNGVVGNNTKRPIDVSVCRGFVLVDPYVPFLFINNKDAKAAQMFTLVHELAHVWLGKSAGFDFKEMIPADDPLEILCNQVAAEFLVPAQTLVSAWKESQQPEKIARQFKVSPIVIARRAMDLELMKPKEFFKFYHYYINKDFDRTSKSAGGDFFATAKKRVSLRFAGFVTQALMQRKITYRDAYQLTGLKGATFKTFMSQNFSRG